MQLSHTSNTHRSNMRYLAVLFFATTMAAKLDKTFLPPNAGSSSGASAGLQAPYGSRTSGNQVQILRYENEINDQGYHYAYETSDGTKAEQDGQVLPGSKPEEGSLRVTGSFSYVADDGNTYSITYTADENGYQATGNHLPTPPPIPQDILKSLQLTAGNGQYSSKKSSYDADAGY